jgi:hypothetical protein
MNIADITEADMTALTAQGYTEADLGMLADTEIKALLTPDSTEEADPHGDAAAAQDAASGNIATQQAAKVDEATEEEADAPFVPQLKAEVPADAAAKISALRQEERDAFKSLMDGVTDADAYQVVRDRVEAEVDTLREKALTASIFTQVNQQTAEQNARNDWNKAEKTMFDGFKTDGLDYKAKPSLLAAYNVNLKALGADPKNEKRDAQWFLAEAHKLTKADLGFVPTQQKVEQKGARVVDTQELPPTLRNVPVAATGAVGSDEFAHMRNLDGPALEKAHAALTEAQRDRWMAE